MTGPTETSEQIELVRRLRRAGIAFCAVPNGGKRDKREAGILRAQGVESGVPDLLIFDLPPFSLTPEEAEIAAALRGLDDAARRRVLMAAGAAAGHAIEMKRADGGVASEEQREWLARLDALGWRTAICHGWQAAAAQLRAWGFKI